MTDYYQPRKISQIMRSDNKISLVGRVVKIGENFFILDDETGKKEIFSETAPEENKILRAFCAVEGGKVKAEIVQPLENFDLNLFKTVEELYNRAGV